MKVFHAAPNSRTTDIQANGLKPTNAPECSCNTGIHVTDNPEIAELWADWLKFERSVYSDKSEEKYQIWVITDISPSSLLKDEMDGNMFEDESWIICTDQTIPPEQLEQGSLV